MISEIRPSVRCAHCASSQEVDLADLQYRLSIECGHCFKDFNASDSDRITALFEVVRDLIEQLNR